MSLERVIAEQQERIDHLEALEASRTKGWQAEFKRLEELLGAVAYFVLVADRVWKTIELTEKDHEMFFKARAKVCRAAAECGFCWHCESIPCTCSDCECED
jgi:hypothetical protein